MLQIVQNRHGTVRKESPGQNNATTKEDLKNILYNCISLCIRMTRQGTPDNM